MLFEFKVVLCAWIVQSGGGHHSIRTLEFIHIASTKNGSNPCEETMHTVAQKLLFLALNITSKGVPFAAITRRHLLL
jgi:hypothetical protein